MRESGVCIKYPLEETTNVTRYSWFERSNLVAYEPGMRRRVSPKTSAWLSVSVAHQSKSQDVKSDGTGVSPGLSAVHREESSPVKDTTSEDRYSMDDDGEGECDLGSKPANSNLPTVLVEHRWSFLFPRSSRLGKPLSTPLFKQQVAGFGALGTSFPHSASLRPVDGMARGARNEEGSSTDCDTESSEHKVTTVQEAFNSPAFGGRSSVLRCLVVDLEMRYISRTQMNYAFHLSAIAERVIHQGVYHLANYSRRWNPVIINEPIDTYGMLRLLKLLKDVVTDDMREQEGQYDDSEDVADDVDGEPPRKFPKVSEDTGIESRMFSTGASANVATESGDDAKDEVEGGQPFSKTRPIDAICADPLNPSTLREIYSSLIASYGGLVEDDVYASVDFESSRVYKLIKKLVGIDCPDSLISGVLECIIRDSAVDGDERKTGDLLRRHVRIERRLVLFECPPQPPSSDVDAAQSSVYCDGTEAVERICLCCSKYAVCPTVFNEYIIFGGTPAIPQDMELGIWIFDSPFTRLKMRDVPVVYHQQVQYSTRKYITIADLNDAILSTRVLNLRMEFCGRGDWVFDDGTLPLNETDKSRTIYGKVVSADDLMQLEFSGTVNQIAKKFFVLQKAFLSTGKEGTSRLIFMDPYASIDASICEDKDYVDHLVDLLTVMYKESPGNFLASCNGYYYYEDGFLPESIDVQRLRNTLFNLESSHYRTAMLADIVADQKHVLGLSQKMPFLTKCKRVMIGKSRIHGYGLFAVDTINKGDLILEYAGVVISDHMADIREAIYDRLLCGSIYMFRLDLNHIIDSTFYGNCARFINHSCDPNTATTNFSYIDEDGFGAHVGIYASKVIPAGEEIYYNYRLSAGSANREVCHCGSYMCTGYMSLVK